MATLYPEGMLNHIHIHIYIYILYYILDSKTILPYQKPQEFSPRFVWFACRMLIMATPRYVTLKHSADKVRGRPVKIEHPSKLTCPKIAGISIFSMGYHYFAVHSICFFCQNDQLVICESSPGLIFPGQVIRRLCVGGYPVNIAMENHYW